MFDFHKRRAEIFRDTQTLYTESDLLRDAVKKSRDETRLYAVDDYPELNRHPDRDGLVTVTAARTFEAAMKLHGEYPGKRIAVLNFASATCPGGGVLKGSGAQEESLCRCSTLYPTLDQEKIWKSFYDVNRKTGNSVHTDDCIYSPGVIICKTDVLFPERMEESAYVEVDVITCAAPNLNERGSNRFNIENGGKVAVSPAELFGIHVKRGKHILHVAAANEADVVVLGAFGCGAFKNDPHVVANAYRTVLSEYAKYFDRVDFAIYCGEQNRPNRTNYDAFREKLA